MEQDARRLRTDALRDPMFEGALRVWEQTRGTSETASLVAALRPLCDLTTNLYRTDMTAEAPMEWSIRIANQAVNMHQTGGERFCDYPDRAYFEDVVVPHHLLMAEEKRPIVHRIRSMVQGRYAVYDRLMLPYLDGERATRSCLSLSRVLLVVEQASTVTAASLSPRERQCLVGVTSGHSAKRIADDAGLAVKTVQHAIERLKAKLGARNVTEAAAKGALLLSAPPAGGSESAATPPLLSPRERQCLGLLASGRSGRQMANELGLSPRTVEKHVEGLKSKLGASNAAEAVAKGLAALAG